MYICIYVYIDIDRYRIILRPINQVPVMSGVPGNDTNLLLTVSPPPDPPRKVCTTTEYY